MKRKIKLKAGAKVLITTLVIGAGIGIYSALKNIGSEAGESIIANILCITGWTYLVFVQIIILAGIWED